MMFDNTSVADNLTLKLSLEDFAIVFTYQFFHFLVDEEIPALSIKLVYKS